MNKVAIVGSREFGDRADDMRVRKQVFNYVRSLPKDSIIVTGGASGVDTWAETAAKEYGLATIIHRAEWRKYGKSAGMIRNGLIVNDADYVVAFWNGYSSGTANSIDRARKAGKPVIINPAGA